MATDKQISANRQNAQKSTGPISDDGKAASSQNAVKHGFYSKDAVIVSPHLTEDQAEYDRLMASLIDELNPQTAFQDCLVARIANCLWRLRRAVIAETAHLQRQLSSAPKDYDFERTMRRLNPVGHPTPGDSNPPESPSDLFAHLVNFKILPEEEFSLNLLRYEMRLDRQLNRAYRLLRQLQKNPSFDPGQKGTENQGNP